MELCQRAHTWKFLVPMSKLFSGKIFSHINLELHQQLPRGRTHFLTTSPAEGSHFNHCQNVSLVSKQQQNSLLLLFALGWTFFSVFILYLTFFCGHKLFKAFDTSVNIFSKMVIFIYTYPFYRWVRGVSAIWTTYHQNWLL